MSDTVQFGPRIEPGGGVTFRLWAPQAQTVDVVIDERVIPLEGRPEGWFRAFVPEARAGTRYRFRIDGDLLIPDPASSYQPEDVAGPSEVIDHDIFPWQSVPWRGRRWHETVCLELHVGTFTEAGTFRAVIERLNHVVAMGFTAIELMPVAEFPGRWNWGYDGVLMYAPDSAYGTPDDLRTLIDAAHARGLMVFLDVVYNHFGPEGNYLGVYAPTVFTADVQTPWGAAIDYALPQMRSFAIENALHWLEHYRFDGLRLDAVHAIARRGDPSVLETLSRAVGALSERENRFIHLVLENDDNSAALIDPRTDPPSGRYRAQWNDDYHHAFHVILTGERQGYYGDYADRPHAALARILSTGFAFQGEASPHRDGALRGEPSGHLPATAFVSFLQNHDQIGNRARGERLDVLAAPEAVEAALAITLLAPMPPMMFMGEEWGSRRPFPFFCNFSGDLAEAVRQGRRREFADAYAHEEDGAAPDPLSEATFRMAKLDWDARDQPGHRRRLDLVRELLELRARFITPRLDDTEHGHNRATHVGTAVVAQWQLAGGRLVLVTNLGPEPARAPLAPAATAIWGDAADDILTPWAVHWGWREE